MHSTQIYNLKFHLAMLPVAMIYGSGSDDSCFLNCMYICIPPPPPSKTASQRASVQTPSQSVSHLETPAMFLFSILYIFYFRRCRPNEFFFCLFSLVSCNFRST